MTLLDKLKEWLLYTSILMLVAGAIFATLFVIQLILMVAVPICIAAAILLPVILVSKKEQIKESLMAKLQTNQEKKQ